MYSETSLDGNTYEGGGSMLNWNLVSLIITILEELNSVFDFVGNIVKACKWIGAKVKQIYNKIHTATKK